jgi:hypothetical protein
MRSVILVRASSRYWLFLFFVCASVGCGSTNVLYTQGQAPIAIPPREGNYENPDNYRVDSAAFPSYVAKHDFSPPMPRRGSSISKSSNVEILTTDTWRVTHKVADKLLVFSDTYQDRQCDHLLESGKVAGAFKSPLGGKCGADYLYGLYISSDGNVIGWMLLRNPKTVALSKDRYTVMEPSLREGSGWPDQPLFDAVR